jgi:hypothetical protein
VSASCERLLETVKRSASTFEDLQILSILRPKTPHSFALRLAFGANFDVSVTIDADRALVLAVKHPDYGKSIILSPAGCQG